MEYDRRSYLDKKYYDGHHMESDLSLEEIEKQLEEEKKKCEKMTEWEEI